MPKMDKTGPMGQGPMTGRGMGGCGGGTRMGWCGRGQGWGMGFGRFFRSPKNQLQVLEDEERMLVEELEAIRSEIEALKSEK